ncbi:hypothetical protein DACRYDRAFT_102053 [Dacryopinax primogenitus]|uniref:Aminoglycoside phosphotransferase domain-containing protein n=1 Tax=Dacryopinax primogenitus (strain DJM 731) TaxID=1858805 RepID=M5G377_DACPD|nr:uncharacterized protein DACRYDRAFT_102053 [Dacryopinax primogenitus]EJT98192.1 hypothetical protein DACRYDRAFT_102053 [Dacryopinax primogenitus]
MLGHFFLEAVEILRTAYPEKTAYLTSVSECAVQGYSSTTYFVTFTEEEGVSEMVLQLRRPEHYLNVSVLEAAREVLGELVPAARLLMEYDRGENKLLAYEMSRIPGMCLSEFTGRKEYVDCLPVTAHSLGSMLGKCCMPGRVAPAEFTRAVRNRLEKAVKSSDPLLASYIDDFRELLDTKQVLDCLPMAIGNGDLQFSNILVDETGQVTGLVDWEDELHQAPLGFDLCFLQWLLGDFRALLTGGKYTLYPNASEIEAGFWGGFFAHLPPAMRVTNTFIGQLEQVMRFGAVFFHAIDGRCNLPSCIGLLRLQLDYTIPVQRLGLNFVQNSGMILD